MRNNGLPSSQLFTLAVAPSPITVFLLLWIYCLENKFAQVMDLKDKRKMYFIPQIDTEVGLWTVKVQVVEIHRSQVTSGKNGQPQKTFKRFVMMDEEGTPVSVVLYEKDIDYYSTYLKQFKRYKISNAKLTPAYSFFKVGVYEFSWVITSDTPVEPIDEPFPPPIPYTYNVCPFNDFILHADKDSNFNIKGIVVHAFPRREINNRSSHREFVIIDKSLMPIILTLWNSYGAEEGEIIAKNIANHPVIIGINMLATTFHGLSLGTRQYSCLLIDPPLTDSQSLKEWYATKEAEITKLVDTGAYKNTDMLLPPPNISDTIDVATAVSTLYSINTVWVTGQIRFTPSQQPYFVCACSNCHKKVDTGCDWFLHCSACAAYEEVELRCRIPVELEGNQKTIRVVLTSPDVERLTGLSGEKMRDAHQFDFNVNDDLLLALDRLHVVCFLKRYDRKTMGTPAGPGLRYSVVKTYALDAIKKDSALLASTSGECIKQLELAEKNVASPTLMSNKETPANATGKEDDCAQPPAKRGIQFISPEENLQEDTEPGNKLTTPKVVKIETTLGEQPGTKPRNKRVK